MHPIPTHLARNISMLTVLQRHILVKGCGRSAPHLAQSRSLSDESVETMASLESTKSVETAPSSPEPDDSSMDSKVDLVLGSPTTTDEATMIPGDSAADTIRAPGGSPALATGASLPAACV